MKGQRLEREVLALPAAQRARLALVAWESLVAEPAFSACRMIDAEGLNVAAARDKEIESGNARPISQEEFLRRTT